VTWLLVAYALYSAGAGAWVGEHTPELTHRLLVALDALSGLVLSFRHTARAAL
jgi:hypothetical protein